MRFDIFERMSKSEAEVFLREYLRLESEGIQSELERAQAEGLRCDFSVESVAPFLEWTHRQVRMIPGEPDLDLPAWIRLSDIYQKNVLEFDDPSKTLVLRASYYLGASFVRQYSSLRWSTGDERTAKCNMPVVSGFTHNMELGPILVAENLFARLTVDERKRGDIAKAVALWQRKVPDVESERLK